MRTRQSFDEQLTELHEGLFRIGTMVEQALTQSLYAVKTYDQELAQTIIDGDLLINDEVQRLHNRALLLIATQQPMASDLRLISVVLSLLPELERMGDYAATIAKVQQRIMRAPTYVPLEAMPEPFPGLISEIGRRTSEILHAGMEALRQRDHSFADRVVQLDDEIDHLYARLFTATVDAANTNPEMTAETIHMLTLAHNLERIGDRVTNVAEQIVYLITGEVVALNY
ncbi:MAG: phosphate signaling complex protein PhoU [Herpetosiphonaceae bacterium]|nr:phosphate signaling complex protein PhoU [Herpetosiphonaceae bacterium]